MYSMSRSTRLLTLMQVLRRHRTPIPGRALAKELGISLRTLYRDIATLQAEGADISGEAGMGYLLHPGFTLPPMMLTSDELEAFLLGMSWVADRADAGLQSAARDVLAKIAAVLPEHLRQQATNSTMLVGPGSWASSDDRLYADLRQGMRHEHKICFAYQDQHGQASERIVWPCAIALFDHVRILIAWCELRQEFRHFRVDRLARLRLLEERYPRRRQDLLREWQANHDQKTC